MHVWQSEFKSLQTQPQHVLPPSLMALSFIGCVLMVFTRTTAHNITENPFLSFLTQMFATEASSRASIPRPPPSSCPTVCRVHHTFSDLPHTHTPVYSMGTESRRCGSSLLASPHPRAQAPKILDRPMNSYPLSKNPISTSSSGPLK